MLVVTAAGDGADAVAAGAAAAHDILPPSVPPTHSSSSIPRPSSAPQPSPVRHPSPVREPTPVRKPTPVRVLTPCHVREPTPDSPRPPSPPPRTEESNEAPQTPTATAGGGAEDPHALTALSLKLDRCLNRVTSLENKLGTTKKVLGGAVLKLVTRVKRLEGLLQQRKQRLVLSDSEGDDATPTEQDIDLEALHTLASMSLGGDSTDKAADHDAAEVPADATMPFHQRRLRKPFTTSAYAHVLDNIPAGADIPAAATTIPVGSSMDAAIHSDAAPSSSIPTAADKGKAPMLGEELAKKIHAEQEAEFARQQEELAQKAQAERVDSPAEHGPGLSDQRRRELDAAQLIYTEADWVDLLAIIATNSALSKQLLGDDVTKDIMNERLGMLLMRKRRELAEQSRVKPMTKTKQRDYMRDFVKNNIASVYNQGWTIKKVKALSIAQLQLEFEYIQQHLERSNLQNFRRSTFRPKPTLDAPSAKRANPGVPQVPAASSQVLASVPAAPTFAADASVSAAATPEVPAVESHLTDTPIASAHISVAHYVAVSTQSSSRRRRKHIAKKRVTPSVDMTDAALIKFDSDSGSDDDPLPYAPYAGWETVPSPLGSVHAYQDMAGHTKHFTTLRELLYMVEKTDLQKLMGAVDNLYQQEDLDTFALLLTASVFTADVSYPLTVATLECMLKHGLEVPKLLVGGDLTMAEQLIGFIKAALLNAQFAV
nr:JmjC domain-containing protein [Tanacetum cinerariifolium]